jgi:23S rRNA (cytidine1920-2'-O)/16S rRNA (cytidine1409-2'-O)-methyltransferase
MRLDEALKAKDLVTSREKAKALIIGGHVKVDGTIILKPSYHVADEVIEISLAMYVSRSAAKLKEALEAWQLDFKDAVILDIGASTGGFTEVALEKGASNVWALDVGKDQLATSLKSDPRVKNLEGVHFLKTSKADYKAFDATLVDVSFISSLKILKHAIDILDCHTYLVLFKPQFETESPQKDHIVKPKMRLAIKNKWQSEVKKMGFSIVQSIDVVPGKKGNQETMMYLKVNHA